MQTDLSDKSYLVTGGSGFFGDCFIAEVLERGATVINVDVVRSERKHPRLHNLQIDIRDADKLDAAFARHAPISSVFHFAALLAHGDITVADMYGVNVDGTRNLLASCKRHGVGNLVFTSTNCLWGEPMPHAIAEDEPARPCEDYGRAKLAAECVLKKEETIACAIIRTPTIIQAGRLGLLAILFEFIDEGRKLWVVGDGSNRYQFIAAHDLSAACLLASTLATTEVFNVGSDEVPPLGDTYQYVIKAAGSSSRLARIPKWLAIPAMKIAHLLHISPLGPYHWRMIAENFRFDTSKAKRMLGWRPTLGNDQILLEAYEYYRREKQEIHQRSEASAHRKATPMGMAIRLLKWLS